jgi:hypothetical protein
MNNGLTSQSCQKFYHSIRSDVIHLQRKEKRRAKKNDKNTIRAASRQSDKEKEGVYDIPI